MILIEFDDDGTLKRTVSADRGTYQNEQWLLEGVSITEVTETGTRVERLTTRIWESEITLHVQVMPILDFLSFMKYRTGF